MAGELLVIDDGVVFVNGGNGQNTELGRRGKLILADGTRFDGRLVGSGRLPVWGEVIFNTSMTGYQEILTDPSYAGQIVVMTYPQIGNYGVHVAYGEKDFCAARALVVRELSPFFSPAPGRRSLESFMVDHGVPGLSDVDTRSLALRVRTDGAVVGVIGSIDHSDKMLLEMARTKRFSTGQHLVDTVSGDLRTEGGVAGRVAVVDFGVKSSIVSSVGSLGVETVIIGTHGGGDGSFPVDELFEMDLDFVVLSNGPGDPADVPGAVAATRELIGRIPVLGICLGHQIAALSIGGHTYKLKFGHRGANQPVICHRTKRVFVTSQNHGYAVTGDLPAIADGVEITYTNLNDGTVEGFRCDDRVLECVQFHPEASPGPHDTSFIFQEFFDRVKTRATGVRSTLPSEGTAPRERVGDAQTS
ncbi:MAG: glutamine-hydrolyzing carbamoyl-phosphate synthase small subunit [Candidatus Latescibacterota bacterium]|nr:MAG: glutamine-hydrolyzing carbamoyl-phosphate synthase small subunit [Candidatus Latescibacterota bacterium]